jgi:hypothetical protein
MDVNIMISVKYVVNNAINFLNEIEQSKLSNLKVEEIDLEEDDYIIVTLGWDEERPLTPLEKMAKPSLISAPTKRVYKTFRVANDSGEVKKMNIRIVNND